MWFGSCSVFFFSLHCGIFSHVFPFQCLMYIILFTIFFFPGVRTTPFVIRKSRRRRNIHGMVSFVRHTCTLVVFEKRRRIDWNVDDVNVDDIFFYQRKSDAFTFYYKRAMYHVPCANMNAKKNNMKNTNKIEIQLIAATYMNLWILKTNYIKWPSHMLVGSWLVDWLTDWLEWQNVVVRIHFAIKLLFIFICYSPIYWFLHFFHLHLHLKWSPIY